MQFLVAQIQSLHCELHKNNEIKHNPRNKPENISEANAQFQQQYLESQTLIDKLDQEYKSMVKFFGLYLLPSN